MALNTLNKEYLKKLLEVKRTSLKNSVSRIHRTLKESNAELRRVELEIEQVNQTLEGLESL